MLGSISAPHTLPSAWPSPPFSPSPSPLTSLPQSLQPSLYLTLPSTMGAEEFTFIWTHNWNHATKFGIVSCLFVCLFVCQNGAIALDLHQALHSTRSPHVVFRGLSLLLQVRQFHCLYPIASVELHFACGWRNYILLCCFSISEHWWSSISASDTMPTYIVKSFGEV